MLKESKNPFSCEFYDAHGLNKIQIHQPHLSIIHLDISSSASHIDKLKMFLSSFKASFNIVCILKVEYPKTISQPST